MALDRIEPVNQQSIGSASPRVLAIVLIGRMVD